MDLDNPWEPLRAAGKAGTASRFLCSMDPADYLLVQRLGDRRDGGVFPAVGVYMRNGSSLGTTILAAADARRMAAALLDAADEADGTTPLVFLPESARKKR